MIPGITYFPVPSTTVASEGAERFFPIFAIFPCSIRRSLLFSVPLVTVMIVAFLMSVGLMTCVIAVCAPADAVASPRAMNTPRSTRSLPFAV